MSTPPSSQTTQEFFPSPSPALSLSLAGIFRDGAKAAAAAEVAAAAENMEVEDGEEASVGGGGSGGRREGTVEISSTENSGELRSSRSDDEFVETEDHDGGGEDQGEGKKKKRRKKYHRHTTEQIRAMENLFKEYPHPDEYQRQKLSSELGLHPRQVKFWFQNRRTQIKQQQGRHENALLKTELDKAREENKALREALSKRCCPACNSSLAQELEEEKQLRAENARLRTELEKMMNAVGKITSEEVDQRSTLHFFNGIFGLSQPEAMALVSQGLEELKFMAVSGEPMWVRSLETGREILNYEEYKKTFPFRNLISLYGKGRYLEASRATGIVFSDLPRLVQSFLDANQWQSMFPSMIAKAAVLNLVAPGEGPMKDGVAQLMFAELQMLTPMVPTREVYFVRHAKQLSPEKWAIVDVSLDKIEITIDVAQIKCRKRGSGCIIEDQLNGHCKVTWLENIELQQSTVHHLFRPLLNSGMAFGANRWLANLKQSCERLVFSMATNVPTKDSIVSPNLVFDFLKDDKHRNEWDAMASGSPAQSIVNLAKGQNRGNAVSIQTIKNGSIWVLQESCTNSQESMVVYAAVDNMAMESVMAGGDSSNVSLLASGFSILPDGVESRRLLNTSKPDDKSTEGGSLVTYAFEVLEKNLYAPQPAAETVELVNSVMSSTLQKIKAGLNCTNE
ncbi:OLC1v1014801C3 [Oldenlandia corymbosa var. corymbosa]|uniref:OLC1v1014801C3 n=1 Tax=Oldenlandia corymbosa var. corymbosa TaxID=529605 RepID=A0AAV1E238_OLDCO|nr:OLC1v1014801C3 [Oldenlandia corymbosa var. corymbosa]